MVIKRLLNFMLSVITVLVVLTLCGCGADKTTTTPANTDESTEPSTTPATSSYDTSKAGYQLEPPADSDTIAVLHTTKGDIAFRFFPDETPKAYENFVTHAQEGYYNNVLFHRVINDFMIQGGDPLGTGYGGESIWGSAFEDEFSGNLLNIRGSVSMANSGANTNGSQFFINQSNAAAFPGWDSIDANADLYRSQLSYDPSLVPDNIRTLYVENGGNFNLDGAFKTDGTGHTVFGQVINEESMAVVDAIAALQSNDTGTPSEEVSITTIDIMTYADYTAAIQAEE